MLLLLAASLTRGLSGVRPLVVERVLALLDGRVAPIVPERGSVGASGDLAPLAHAALVLLGEGRRPARGRINERAPKRWSPSGLSRSCSKPRRAWP